jgi:hypothetical protein
MFPVSFMQHVEEYGIWGFYGSEGLDVDLLKIEAVGPFI